MGINLHLPSQLDTLKPKITVIGVGGAGGNAVNNMIASNLEGVDFVVANTDAQALENAQTGRVVQLGASVTRGLGAGANPEIGRAAAEEAMLDIAEYIEGSNMVFITAGMGGGTGTGAAPVIARLAKEQGMLTVGVVTKPFHFEGAHRMRIAESGISELQQYVDTLIIIPNQNLFRIANEKTTFAEAFCMADEVLHSGVRGVTDLMVKPGLVNLDFADIRAVMSEMGKAMMGTGEATGDRRALEASEAAISNPLLDDVSLKGARAVLINITGGPDMTLFEVDEAANRIRDEVDPDANIIFGSTFSDAMAGKMRVSVVATGIDAGEMRQKLPQMEMTAAAQAARKPYHYTPAAKKPEPAVPAKPIDRSPSEIVRQAGSPSVSEMARQAAARVASQQQPAAMPPMVRIVDESVQDESEFIQQAAQSMAQSAGRVEEAMRIASQARSSYAATSAAEAPGPLFMAPRAEQPQQRTLFAPQPQNVTFEPISETSIAEEFAEQEPQEATSGGIFGRLSKALGGAGRAEAKLRDVTPEPVAEPRKAEVRESRPAAAEEEELYDIPAFLRRQAN
jgi:cell division protein FtsZ